MTLSIDNATPEEWDAIVQAHHAGVVAQSDDKSDHLLRRLNAALEKPFGDVPIYWRCIAFALWQAGYPIEHSIGGAYWNRTPTPQWSPKSLYRIAEKPEELVLPSIDWSHVAARWKWMAQDKDGQLWLYHAQPEVSVESGWWFVGGGKNTENHEAGEFASAKKGKGDWRKLIVQRPEGV
ncbi:hypothetical protein EHZ19_10730 [Paraburkholderia bannensis]|nr:hypothetical protein [Paraburkholderia bannensis]RQM48670.1 hypothetical protein EHZ19_10730 [Paraburkholderia bannensis]